MLDLKSYLSDRQKLVNEELDRRLPPAGTRPATLHEAMRYSVFAGGKRLRPILCLAAAEACGGESGNALPLGAAVECIHTYSLIHDDLPCMDDDDFRRGQPTCHRKFGEGVAVLAGDALLTIAFEILAEAEGSSRYRSVEFVRELAVTAGSRHLVGGQVLDLEGEGKGAEIDADDLRYIHESKTAALLTTAIRLGAMSADADPEDLDALTEFGASLGLAFQVIDDILDVTQTAEKLGKSAGKDAGVEKATYPAVFGIERSREEAARLTGSAVAAIASFGERGAALQAIVNYLLDRDY